jgi:hypothetical protein
MDVAVGFVICFAAFQHAVYISLAQNILGPFSHWMKLLSNRA